METFFVVTPDGQKFGPADINTLSQWAAEGRLFPTSILESSVSGQQTTANNIPGIIWPQAGAGTGGYANYARPGGGVVYDSWIDRQFRNTNLAILVLAAFCCGCPTLIFSIWGVIACKDPVAKKNATTTLVVSLVFQVILGILRFAIMASGINSR